MKELVTGRQLGVKEHCSNPSFGLFIVTNNDQVILHKRPLTAEHSSSYHWAPPRIRYDTQTQTPRSAAQDFLHQAAIEGQLHEAFTPGIAPTAVTDLGFLMIALTPAEGVERYCLATGTHSIPLNQVLREIDETPQYYAPWLRKCLEGIALYLKNLRKNSTLQHEA